MAFGERRMDGDGEMDEGVSTGRPGRRVGGRAAQRPDESVLGLAEGGEEVARGKGGCIPGSHLGF